MIKQDNKGNSVIPFSVAPYAPRPGLFKLEIQPKYTGGIRLRRFFRDEAEAYLFGQDIVTRIKEQGTRSIAADGITVKEAVKRFLAIRGEKMQPIHKRHTERVCKQLVHELGNRILESISPLDLHKLWDRPGLAIGKSGQRQTFNYLRMLFNWFEKYDLISHNPTRRLEAPPIPKSPKRILTPEQMREALVYLKSSRYNYLVAFFCLGGFAGLRTSEAVKIVPSDLDWNLKEIWVRPENKTGERYVGMKDNFIRNCPRDFNMPNQRSLYRALKNMVRDLGWQKWPENCLRHSFATYELAFSEDANKTAYKLGHSSPKMVNSTYARAARKEAALIWEGL